MLEAVGLRKRWHDGPQVLDGVSLVLPAGRLGVIEGANGAGKSTLVRLIAGLVDPDAGAIRVKGFAPADRAAYQREIGLVAAASSGLYGRLDAAGHLELAAGVSLLPRSRRRALIRAATERFELRALGCRRVDRLSMGQRQRLRLALGFLHEPGLVLLDEPLTSLDPAGCALLARALAEHLDAGGSALWVAPVAHADPRPHVRLRLASGRLSPA